LIGYLGGKLTLLNLLINAQQRLMLDSKLRLTDTDSKEEVLGKSSNRILRDISEQVLPKEYLPAEDSYFEESLAPDVSLENQVNPENFDLPIDGDWFFSDWDRFSGLYGQLYAFFYCTKSQFITNIGQKIGRYLRSPWEGGFSRVNLFQALQGYVPSLHDLEIKKIQYSSPGQIEVEALPAVAGRVSDALRGYFRNESNILECEKAINSFLSSSKLRRRDVSRLSDEQIGLTRDQIQFLLRKIAEVSEWIGIHDEIKAISQQSPNAVVTAKVVVALVGRIRRLAEFQVNGQLKLI
jgi:hypothetical protein